VGKTILLVEDSEDDVLLVRRRMTQAGIVNPIFVVGDGDDAIAYLKGDHIYADRNRFPSPAILLLDLKMPRMSGFEVLNWCKSTNQTRDLFIVVLSHQDELREVSRAYALGAKTFLIKPPSTDDFTNLARSFPDYWELLPNPNSKGPATNRGLTQTPEDSTKNPSVPTRGYQNDLTRDNIAPP